VRIPSSRRTLTNTGTNGRFRRPVPHEGDFAESTALCRPPTPVQLIQDANLLQKRSPAGSSKRFRTHVAADMLKFVTTSEEDQGVLLDPINDHLLFGETAPRFLRLELTNFLSYKSASVSFSDFSALVGPNASGKSNAVAAIKLLTEIPTYGLPVALARRGGFDQLRHRSAGRPYDPALRLTFQIANSPESYYELSLGAVKGARYRVKRERAEIHLNGATYSFHSDGHKVEAGRRSRNGPQSTAFVVAPGQSALASAGMAGYLIYEILSSMATVEVNPAKVAELQEPSSTREFESDGSNVASILDTLDTAARSDLIDQVSAIVPGIVDIEAIRVADRQTLRFKQQTSTGNREFFAKQMSDGTLRAFAILLATLQPSHPRLLVIEEPEIAIHLGALRTLVELLEARATDTQILITTHSADIVDALPIDSIRVVWIEGDSSHIAPISEHSKEPVRQGLITPGELLRADSLDPELG